MHLFDRGIDDEGHIDDEGLHALVEGLKHCRNLTSLTLYGNLMITEEGSRSLSTLFQSDDCQLEDLNLGRMNIVDDGMAALAHGLASLTSLKTLYLRDMSISNQGLHHLAEHCNLCKLSFWDIHLGDDGAVALANGLIRNKSLTELTFSRDSGITARGWSAFSKLLCDKSSVNNTYLSNHTLLRIGLYDTPQHTTECLRLNHKQAPAICKRLFTAILTSISRLYSNSIYCVFL